MLVRICLLSAILLTTCIPAAAQIVRFDTSLGEFDVVLLPEAAPLNVENFLNYVESGRYDNTVIHRAQGNFVVQMGSFGSTTMAPPPDVTGFINIETDPPVEGEPAATTGLSNTVGTVALALPGDGMGGTNQDGGTSSFFVNGGDNSFLDEDFTVFGMVPDMTTINNIFAADEFDNSTGRYPNSLAYSDIPLQANGDLVFINTARVVIPEPSGLILAAIAMGGLILLKWRRPGRGTGARQG